MISHFRLVNQIDSQFRNMQNILQRQSGTSIFKLYIYIANSLNVNRFCRSPVHNLVNFFVQIKRVSVSYNVTSCTIVINEVCREIVLFLFI